MQSYLAEVALSKLSDLPEELIKVVLVLSRDVATLVEQGRVRGFERDGLRGSVSVERVWGSQVKSSSGKLIAE